MNVDAGGAGAASETPRFAVLTISDGVAAGTREDTSGAAIAQWVAARGATATCESVPDAADRIVAALITLADDAAVDVIVTTGGTGLTARDVTPEATRVVIEREVPGLAERLRAAGTDHTPHAVLSRGIAGVRGATLIVNLPGSTGGVRDGLRVLEEVIDHAVQLLRGEDTDSHPPRHG